ncbi:MAG: hypothetical protein ACK4HV_05655 [Parachlamydiaceae bacterium]
MIGRLKTFIFFLAITSSLSAFMQAEKGIDCPFQEALIEFKAGYFNFFDSKLRKIYNRGGFDAQISLSYPLGGGQDCPLSFSAYGAIEYYRKSGQSLDAHQKTSIWSIPVNLGLKTFLNLHTCLDAYFTLGPRYFFIKQHNHSSYVNKNRSRNGIGFFANTGFIYRLSHRIWLDTFAEYSYGKIRFKANRASTYSRRVQVSGYTIGLGLGVGF